MKENTKGPDNMTDTALEKAEIRGKFCVVFKLVCLFNNMIKLM